MTADLDARVKRVLEDRRGTWRDMNVPEADGRALHEIVLKNRYTRALEIGTSTGHSGLWNGWALAKTGGRLITGDIDEWRHREAVANFKAAGLDRVIDARLADAHELVPKLPGPYDFVFIDADKEWYTNYARAVLPKLQVGGVLTAHNVYVRRRWRGESRRTMFSSTLSVSFAVQPFRIRSSALDVLVRSLARNEMPPVLRLLHGAARGGDTASYRRHVEKTGTAGQLAAGSKAASRMKRTLLEKDKVVA